MIHIWHTDGTVAVSRNDESRRESQSYHFFTATFWSTSVIAEYVGNAKDRGTAGNPLYGVLV